ncbi:TPM domain-containing protein [Marivita sp.]|uniref:TPM domain-containing protein n=1 Tax=Marivita sp. TaxID=2003365 RepID=UPI003F6D201D
MRWVFAVLLFLAAPLWAQSYPDYDRTTITDRADLLTDAQEAALDTRLSALRRDTGVEFAVLTLASQAPYAAALSLEDFATGLFDHWGIGDATRNDGIFVLVLSQDRAMRIELGAAYGREWDRVAADIIDRSFLPAFSNDDYATGIADGVEDVIASIALPFRDGADAPTGNDSVTTWAAIMGFIAIWLVAARRKIGDWATRLKSCPKCGHRALSRVRNTLRAATTSMRGEGETRLRCSQCGYEKRETYIIPTRSSSSGGSFGGGRSGGGGASGRW